jgi:hypothetical protein
MFLIENALESNEPAFQWLAIHTDDRYLEHDY